MRLGHEYCIRFLLSAQLERHYDALRGLGAAELDDINETSDVELQGLGIEPDDVLKLRSASIITPIMYILRNAGVSGGKISVVLVFSIQKLTGYTRGCS